MAQAQLRTRNPMAGVLSHGAFQPQFVRARKGKGSFTRKDKHKNRSCD